jgi:hypothetical protein
MIRTYLSEAMPMSRHRTVASLEMIPAGADIGFAMWIWSWTGAFGDTQPRVNTATAVAKAVSPMHFNIVVSLANPGHSPGR